MKRISTRCGVAGGVASGFRYSESMRVRVLYFGMLREIVGATDETVDVVDGVRVDALLHILRERTSKQAMADKLNLVSDERLWRSLAVAVNREYSSPEVVLRDGDEVALLPPVSGGSFTQKYGLATLGGLNAHAD
jgi:molybdopterin converting factor subunit 1